jgi:hypothetical protein
MEGTKRRVPVAGAAGRGQPFRGIGYRGRSLGGDMTNRRSAMRRRLGVLLAATGAAATMSLSAQPAFAAGQSPNRGAIVEEFVCFFSSGDTTRLGTGKIVTTPSGNSHLVCTGKPL